MRTEQEIMERLKDKIEALRELDEKEMRMLKNLASERKKVLEDFTIKELCEIPLSPNDLTVEEYEVMDQLAEAICELEWVLKHEADN